MTTRAWTNIDLNSAKAVFSKQFELEARFRNDGGYRYVSNGLKCRVCRPGVFRLRRKDGLCVVKDRDFIQVLIENPRNESLVAVVVYGDDHFF